MREVIFVGGPRHGTRQVVENAERIEYQMADGVFVYAGASFLNRANDGRVRRVHIMVPSDVVSMPSTVEVMDAMCLAYSIGEVSPRNYGEPRTESFACDVIADDGKRLRAELGARVNADSTVDVVGNEKLRVGELNYEIEKRKE
jgi:hypothetical protein